MIPPLKYKYQTRDQIPADQATFYAERDGAWLLDVEGAVDKQALDELRQNHNAIIQERDELKQRFAGIDPDEVKRLTEEKRLAEEKAALASGRIDEVLSARLKPLQEQLKTLSTERDDLTSRLVDLTINQAAVSAASKRGLRPSAIPDLTTRARSVFRLDAGVPRAFEPDGKTVRLVKGGPMTLEEWVEDLTAEAPHLFESNSGGGAPGNVSAGTVNTDNPWKRETFNLTKQGQLLKADPAKARALMRAAGLMVNG